MIDSQKAKQTQALQAAWWRRENARPLVGTFAPVPMPPGQLDCHVAPEGLAAHKAETVAAGQVVPADNMPAALVDFGPAFLSALAGAGFEADPGTSWSVPCAETIDALEVRPFDPDLPLWREYVVRFEALLAGWSWETYLPGPTVMTGPLDILAGCLGPQALAMELFENPEGVVAKGKQAARLFLDVYEAQLRMLRAAGWDDGVVDWMRTWMPGRGLCYSEDVAALVGPHHFRDVFIPANEEIFDELDTPYLHLHSAALPSLEPLLEQGRWAAIELSNDVNGPDQDKLIAAGKRIQAAGVPVQMSNWERPLGDDEIDRLLGELDPAGLKITLQAESLDQAQRYYDRVVERFA